MSDKEYCPGCKRYSSSVLIDWRNIGVCGECGLSYEVAQLLKKAEIKGVEKKLLDRNLELEKHNVLLLEENAALVNAFEALKKAIRGTDNDKLVEAIEETKKARDVWL